MEEGAKRTIEIGVSCAAAGIIVGVLSLTGLGGKFSEVLINLTGGSLLLALIGTMVAAIILGTGLPTTAAYAIGASVLAPALIRLGAPALAAHVPVLLFGDLRGDAAGGVRLLRCSKHRQVAYVGDLRRVHALRYRRVRRTLYVRARLSAPGGHDPLAGDRSGAVHPARSEHSPSPQRQSAISSARPRPPSE
ncbi:MAG TPA: TRAP transporter large permease subunit [bacterium]|nr:TRAP transporter large permease subunit [bacterium]